MEITWVKLKTKMFDDEKIQLIESMPEADAILVIWIKLLIQAGKTNQNGYIFLSEDIPFTVEMLSTIFRRPLQIVKFALKTLANFGMIEVTDSNVICISNWEKHQNTEGLEKIRENNRIRQARFREQKALKQHKNEDDVTLRNVTVTQQIKSKIKNKIKNNKEDKMKSVSDEYFLDLLPIDSSQQFIESWTEWVDFRKEIKKKVVRTTAKKQIGFLISQSDPVECINQSIKNGWTGLFEARQTEKKPEIKRNHEYTQPKESKYDYK